MHAQTHNCMQPFVERKDFPCKTAQQHRALPLASFLPDVVPQKLVRGSKAERPVNGSCTDVTSSLRITVREPLGNVVGMRLGTDVS